MTRSTGLAVRVLVMTALAALAACGGEPAGSPAGDTTVGGDIAEGYNRQLDKTAAVEDQLEAAQEKREEALAEAEGDVSR